jgi:hypothetical protein
VPQNENAKRTIRRNTPTRFNFRHSFMLTQKLVRGGGPTLSLFLSYKSQHTHFIEITLFCHAFAEFVNECNCNAHGMDLLILDCAMMCYDIAMADPEETEKTVVKVSKAPNNFIGCVFCLYSAFYIFGSLAPYLAFGMALSAGSIVVDPATSKVIDYHEFGGGIVAFMATSLYTLVLFPFPAYVAERRGLADGLLSLLMIVVAFKIALLARIFSFMNIDPLILAQIPRVPLTLLDALTLGITLFAYWSSSRPM